MKRAKQQQDLVEELTKTGDASLSEVLKTRGQVNEIQSTIVNKRNAYRQEAQADLAKNRGDLEQAEQVLRQRQQALNSTQLRAPMPGIVTNGRITTMGPVIKPGAHLMQTVPTRGAPGGASVGSHG